MKNKFTKYSIKIVSLALLISFIYTNLSLSELLISSCNSDMTSCCCKNHQTNNTLNESIKKSCCCEVNEMTEQPAEVNLFTADNSLKNLYSNAVLSYFFAIIDKPEDSGRNIRFISLYSPPKTDIHILNSNFRI